jgi:hypothetical protein
VLVDHHQHGAHEARVTEGRKQKFFFEIDVAAQ